MPAALVGEVGIVENAPKLYFRHARTHALLHASNAMFGHCTSPAYACNLVFGFDNTSPFDDADGVNNLQPAPLQRLGDARVNVFNRYLSVGGADFTQESYNIVGEELRSVEQFVTTLKD